MLFDEIDTKPEKNDQVVDDMMDEFESIGMKIKSGQSIETKEKDGDHRKKRKKHHRHHSPKDSKHDRQRSSHKDHKRRRRSSKSTSDRSRSSSDSDRSSPRRHRSSKKSRNGRNDSPPRRKVPIPDKPVLGSIYEGTVTSIMQYGCFVRLEQFRDRTEGLLHISNVS